MRRSLLLTTLALSTWYGGCGPEILYETLEADAARACDLFLACYPGYRDVPNYHARCVDEFMDESEWGLKEGAKCANRYAQLVRCISEMTCEEHVDFDFWDLDPEAQYTCNAESLRFLDECEETFYADQVRR